jgi:hypothetical protein
MQSNSDESWLSWAFHLFMPRFLPTKDETHHAEIISFFAEFLATQKLPLFESIQSALTLWKSPLSTDSLPQLLKELPPASCYPIFLPNHNSLLCLMRERADNLRIYAMPLQWDENCPRTDTRIDNYAIKSKIVLPRYVVRTSLAFFLAVTKDLVKLSKAPPNYPTSNKANGSAPENREVPLQTMVLDWFLPSLSGTIEKNPFTLAKAARTETIFENYVPWRRNAAWNGLRFFLHFFLRLSIPDEETANFTYKSLILKFLIWYLEKADWKRLDQDDEFFEILSDSVKKIANKAKHLEDLFPKHPDLGFPRSFLSLLLEVITNQNIKKKKNRNDLERGPLVLCFSIEKA